MYESLPSFVLGFHGCDKSVGERIISGKDELKMSDNTWDWLGGGIYFWEHNPVFALEYAQAVAEGTQFAKGKIKTPFVVGAIIDLGYCLNLTTVSGVKILKKGYNGLYQTMKKAGTPMPKNKEFNQRFLDTAVIEYIHQLNKDSSFREYDAVRGAFNEGEPIYPGTGITSKNHIQICVRNFSCIKGYFLPTPTKEYNPNL